MQVESESSSQCKCGPMTAQTEPYFPEFFKSQALVHWFMTRPRGSQCCLNMLMRFTEVVYCPQLMLMTLSLLFMLLLPDSTASHNILNALLVLYPDVLRLQLHLPTGQHRPPSCGTTASLVVWFKGHQLSGSLPIVGKLENQQVDAFSMSFFQDKLSGHCFLVDTGAHQLNGSFPLQGECGSRCSLQT